MRTAHSPDSDRECIAWLGEVVNTTNFFVRGYRQDPVCVSPGGLVQQLIVEMGSPPRCNASQSLPDPFGYTLARRSCETQKVSHIGGFTISRRHEMRGLDPSETKDDLA